MLYHELSDGATLVRAWGTRRRGLPMAVAALMGLAACTPYPFSKETADFSGSLTQVADAYRAGTVNWDNERMGLLHRVRVDQRAALELTDACIRSSSSIAVPCEIVSPRPANNSAAKKWAASYQDHLDTLVREATDRKQAQEAFTVLISYAQALKAVTNADDRAKFDAASKRVGAAVGNLASAAKEAAPGIDVVAPAVTNLLLWGVGLALDYDRYQALSKATSIAGPHIDVVATGLGQALDRIRGHRLTVLRNTAEVLATGLNTRLTPDSYDRRLTATEDIVTRIGALQGVNPTQVARDLVKAHEELVNAIADHNKQLPHLIAAIEQFTQQADALHNALISKKK